MKHLALNQAEAHGEKKVCSIPEYLQAMEGAVAEADRPKVIRFVHGFDAEKVRMEKDVESLNKVSCKTDLFKKLLTVDGSVRVDGKKVIVVHQDVG